MNYLNTYRNQLLQKQDVASKYQKTSFQSQEATVINPIRFYGQPFYSSDSVLFGSSSPAHDTSLADIQEITPDPALPLSVSRQGTPKNSPKLLPDNGIKSIAESSLNDVSPIELMRQQKVLKVILRDVKEREKPFLELHSLLGDAIGGAESPIGKHLIKYQNTLDGLDRLVLDGLPGIKIVADDQLKTVNGELRRRGLAGSMYLEKASDFCGDNYTRLKNSLNLHTVLATVLGGTGMFFKNVAWYGTEYLVPLEAISPDSAGSPKALPKRWVVANSLASGLEYPFAVASQKLWKGQAAHSMSTWLGMAQAFDMLWASLLLKLTGDNISIRQGSTLGGAAFTVGIQTGMFNRPANAIVKYIFKTQDNTSPNRRLASLVTGAPENPNEAESGGIPALPMGKAARQLRVKVRHLADAFPDTAWERHKKGLQGLFSHLVELKKIVTTKEENDHLETFEKHLSALLPQTITRESAPNQTGIKSRFTSWWRKPSIKSNLDDVLVEMRDIDETLQKNGGAGPLAIGIGAGASALYGALLVLGNVKQKNLNHRALINALASVMPQTAANLGHLFFKDNPKHGAFKKVFISWARTIPPAIFEFVPLQWAVILAHQAKALAGKAPGAPRQNFPPLSDIRSAQESVRLFSGITFSNVALGEKWRPQHIWALVTSASITVGSMLGGYKEALKSTAQKYTHIKRAVSRHWLRLY